MAVNHELIKRHVSVNGKSTTVSMERLYWSMVDRISGLRNQSSSKFLETIIAAQPADYNSRAGWIRYCLAGQCLVQLSKAQRAASKAT